jgi:hypothetical protein
VLNRLPFLAGLLLAICSFGLAQESNFGVSVPVTASGDARFSTGALASSDGGPATAGYRVALYPALRLGDHWFFYSAIDLYSSSYFPYQTGSYVNQPFNVDVRQAYVGYATTLGSVSVVFKAGQVASAFGLFPINYDDANSPFVSPPPIYSVGIPVRPDQLPCGMRDIWRQSYGDDLDFHCGGSTDDRYGLAPVTLFGLPGATLETSWHRVDARVQITNSSPANPHSLLSNSQSAQWTAGAGCSLPGGLHLGVSGYRGPYLDNVVSPFLPHGEGLRSFLSSGFGGDLTWSRGPLSAQGEWQHFRLDLPNFQVSPSQNAAYGQLKVVLTPRTFVAARVSTIQYGRAQDNTGTPPALFTSSETNLAFSAGYRFNRLALLKAEYDWTHLNAWTAGGWYWPPNQGNFVALQFVTSFTAISRAFHQ